jgi:hypothetical protein
MKIEIKLIPDGMDLSKEIQDGIPVDKMQDACPIATQDVETNEENSRYAIKDHQYGPAVNPDESCGVCAYFNITPSMQQCMKDDSGEVGYCQLLKFMCSASNSCSAWEAGGPMVKKPCDCQDTHCDCE